MKSIYNKLRDDFEFISKYGFHFSYVEHHYVMPSVVFSDGTQRLQIGMHFDDGRMFVLFYEFKEQIRGESIIGNIKFLSRKYNDQVQTVREIVDQFLQSI